MPKYASEELENQAKAAVEDAKVFIASPPGPPAERFNLAKALAGFNKIDYARKVLEKADQTQIAQDDLLRLKLPKQLALYTYKDQDLPVASRLQKAEAILRDLLPRIDSFAPADAPPKLLKDLLELKQDTWGILGAIEKVRFNAFASRKSLEGSLKCYLAGYKLGVNPDGGAYTGLNAAFIMDLLVSHLPVDEPAAKTTREAAQQIRSEIVPVLKDAPKDKDFVADQWYYAKLTEAYLGSGDYPHAKEAAEKIDRDKLKKWELETMARQFTQIARLQAQKEGKSEEIETSDAWSVVKVLLGGNATAALSFLRGKVGLALSGGGFRASLYHIGVLASLAEQDMLRHVEVISCVSGGSIVGMYYYLKLRECLHEKQDGQIDYVKLVQEMEQEFLDGVQKNLRMRAFFSIGSNYSVVRSRHSSSTNRLGRLYESQIYSKIYAKDRSKQPKYMDEITIHPGGQQDFYPRYDNWQRQDKVPILVLNSTTLNTCHNWQFTASFMGEPPTALEDAQIDANDRLRRMYYDEAPTPYRRIRIGDAVAASACVPGLFDPLVLDGLYKENYVVRLVDGGVFDNQGVASLREQDCSVMLVSDASGQTGIEKDPSGDHLGVSLRANDVLMARIRECEHQLLCSLQEAKVLRGLMFVHLKKGLAGKPVDWVDTKDPSPAPPTNALTSYRIRQDVQGALAAVRTDLDSFSNCEADTLMLSGYRATSVELSKSISGFALKAPPANPGWRFFAISGIASQLTSDNPDLKRLQRSLLVARSRTFKAFKLLRFIQLINAVVILGLLAALWYLVKHYWGVRWPVVEIATLLGILFVLSSVAQIALVRLLRYRNGVTQWFASLGLLVGGGPFLWLHLNFVDRYYINWGPKYRN